MKTWVKLTKFFQGGSYTDYKLVDTLDLNSDDFQQELMEDWGENSDGGHAYGYRVELHVMNNEAPPVEWLRKAIKNAEQDIEYHENQKIEQIRLISVYQQEILKNY